MSDEIKPVQDPKLPRKKTAKELIDASIDDLSIEELERRTAVIKAAQAEADLQDVKDRLDERKNKREMIKDRFLSRGKELQKTAVDQKKHQDNCSHRKGGRGLDALQKGGTASDYAVIRHLLPWNEWYQRCQRCGKTWKPPHRVDYADTPAGQAEFDAAKVEYKDALSWNTDNIPSTGITFTHSDGGVWAHEMIKDTTLR